MNLKKATLLIIDDDTDVLIAVKLLLKTEVKEVVTEKNPEKLDEILSQHSFDLILLDMNFKSSVNTGNEGLFWLRYIKESGSSAAVIMITAYGDIELAVRSLKEGAADFVVKPWHNEKLLETIKDVLDKAGNNKTAVPGYPPPDSIIGTELMGVSNVMQGVFFKIEKIAPTDANILILGENGTGKDLIARAIHQKSQRSKKPYVKVDVGALTETLFESELFGHKKGAFTDAKDDRTGRFESANEGTLFLDEIGNISLQQQAKLLSVLQNVPIDIRLICATNLELPELADETCFRKDLIYRINTVDIIVPPLREREEDIPLLANHFAHQYAAKYMRPGIQLDKSALDKLQQYHFPGNVRELQYIIERAIIMADSSIICADDLIFSPIEARPKEEISVNDTKLSIVEKNTIIRVIEKYSGNITKAAKELGLTRTALYRRLNKYDI
jgi:DNA-binding NtrC family response regulator